MSRYVTLGQIPRKRHTQFRKPDGGLYAEQVFGTRGFSGIASTLYHTHLPTQTEDFVPLPFPVPEMAPEDVLRHHHMKTQGFGAGGDPITGRVPLMLNDDMSIGLCRPTEPMAYFYKNADGDDLLFVQEGSGHLETLFGTLAYGPGDYLVIPRGVIYRAVADPGETRLLVIESHSPVESPRRYRNEYGQMLEHAPYCERDIRVPETLETHDEAGRFEVRIQVRGRLTAYFYPHRSGRAHV